MMVVATGPAMKLAASMTRTPASRKSSLMILAGLYHPPRAAGSRAGSNGVEREALPRQGAERRAIAPVESQESAGLARRRAGHARALDHRHANAAAGQAVGYRGAHDAGTADD